MDLGQLSFPDLMAIVIVLQLIIAIEGVVALARLSTIAEKLSDASFGPRGRDRGAY
jgi:hypothetical protein